MKWKKLVSESEKGKLTIPTGLKGKVAREILDSVIGQMSDGMWENSPMMEHYWRFIKVIDKGSQLCLEVTNCAGERSYDEYIDNYFVTKMRGNPEKIKEFIGKKVKEVVKEEIKDTHDEIGWTRNNEHESKYLYGTFSDCYFVYETLIGRTGYEKKYPGFMRDAMLV